MSQEKRVKKFLADQFPSGYRSLAIDMGMLGETGHARALIAVEMGYAEIRYPNRLGLTEAGVKSIKGR